MNGYKDLRVWQQSIEFARRCHQLLHDLPPELRYSLGDQIRRASISIPSNLAEGFGRHSKNEMKRFARISLGSSYELETQIILLKSFDVQPSLLENIIQMEPCLQSIIRMLVKLIRSLN
ncbi:four helix bundle protein [Candidatus Uhrbacteria bacterium]|nr:four helix bundle protein [Candidatus Uhrbacteria bacterium]MBD3284021.1 four helix bundle protein [Candidatus Uhrbacteria bacterium]